MILLRAVDAELTQFCAVNVLLHKAIIEIRKLRIQLSSENNLAISGVNLTVDPGMSPASDAHARFLRQILLAGVSDRVTCKVPLSDVTDKEEKRRLKYVYHCTDMLEPVFMHSSAVLRLKQPPEWVIYHMKYKMMRAVKCLSEASQLLSTNGFCSMCRCCAISAISAQ